jgi:hypothetical protein
MVILNSLTVERILLLVFKPSELHYTYQGSIIIKSRYNQPRVIVNFKIKKL